MSQLSPTSPNPPQERLQRYVRVAEVFSPSAPVDSQELFSGRFEQVRTVINAVAQRGQHVILYGERGVGKTSLANVISQIMQSHGLQGIDSGVINCDGSDDFSSLWHKVFRELRIAKQKNSMGFDSAATIEEIALDNFAPEKITPETVRYLIQNTIGKAIIVLDEIDRIKKRQVTTLLADTIKTLSDHSVDTTLILVGVSDSVEGLIAEHASVERSLVQVQMPRMSLEELYEILNKGLGLVGMTIDDDAKHQIAVLSQGLPSYTHLLALHAAQSAITEDRVNISLEDLRQAINMAVDKAQQSIINAYHKATSSSRETIYAEVLLACALAKADSLGCFTAADVRCPMSAIMKKTYNIPAFSRHLNDFCEDKKGPILLKKGSSHNYRYRFINPMMQPYVIMNGINRGLISPENLQAIQAT